MPDIALHSATVIALAVALSALVTARRARHATPPKPPTRKADGHAPAAFIDIVERGRTTDESLGGSVILPDEVRINGIPLAVPEGRSVIVHEMVYGGNDPTADLAQVTLTLFARRVTIAAEGDLDA